MPISCRGFEDWLGCRMPMSIHRLSAEIAGKIAAGEVIERPASVVKELLENSIDAKSESISVSLVDGGKTMIEVRDDGEGMGRDDLLLCSERHTTSKLGTEDDLNVISSLGFRGEALASISAVSKMRIVSCPKDGSEGRELSLVPAQEHVVKPAARGPGTTTRVEDLFFNLPARLKFLGTARTESLHAHRVLQRLALSYPEVSWSLVHGGRIVLSAPSASSVLDRIAQVYNWDVAKALIPIESEKEGIGISGFIGRPDLKRGNRRDQLFCVNGRPVSDRGLSYVLASAYGGMMRRGTYPLAVVSIAVSPDRVDVNVHPRKEEVRFGAPRGIQDALSAALQKALASRYVVAPLVREGGSVVREPGPAFSGGKLAFDLKREISVEKKVREQEKVRVGWEKRAIGQLQNTYILVETDEGLEIVDQHIAHERILYEELESQLKDGEIPRQSFLIPVRLELPLEDASHLEAGLGQLKEVGIVLDEFGGGTFMLREYPAALAEQQARYGFDEVAVQLAEVLVKGEKVRDALFRELLNALSCAAAIKAGHVLSLREQQSLIESLAGLENPYTCPHGRPIIFSISRQELDRRFQRS